MLAPPVGVSPSKTGTVVVHLLHTDWEPRGHILLIDGWPVESHGLQRTAVVAAGRRRVEVRHNLAAVRARRWVDIAPGEQIELYYVPSLSPLPGTLFRSPQKYWGLANAWRSLRVLLMIMGVTFAALGLAWVFTAFMGAVRGG